MKKIRAVLFDMDGLMFEAAPLGQNLETGG